MVVVASDDGDEEEVYYLYGRFFYYLANFDPIEEATILGRERTSPEEMISHIEREFAEFQQHKGKIRLKQDSEEPIDDDEFYNFTFNVTNQEDYFRIIGYIANISVSFLNASIGAASANTSLCEGNYTVAKEYY